MARTMEGKVALVTGATGGIGQALARRFAQAGASVVVTGRREDALNDLVDELTSTGCSAFAVTGDVAIGNQAEVVVARAVEHFGRLDYAVNNAGVIDEPAPTHEIGEEAWERIIAVNLTGVWACMKHELAQMTRQGSGAIVNISSVGGIHSAQDLSGYSASKHGVVGLSRTAGVEYAAQGIRVNALAPGWVDTPMTVPVDREVMNSVPIGRPARPEEIANVAVWLCSDEASYVTGSVVVADGGMFA